MINIVRNIKLSHLLLVSAGFLLLLKLGFWQLTRAEEKRQRQMTFTQNQLLPPGRYNPKQHYPPYRRLVLTGHYDSQHQFLLDNQWQDHKLGYVILTPFMTNHTAVLVNRGWVPRGETRAMLPALPISTEAQKIVGTLVYPEQAITLSQQQENPDQWPRVIQAINLANISQALAVPTAEFTVRLAPLDTTLFRSSRHTAYAVQWFLLAGALLITYIVRISSEK